MSASTVAAIRALVEQFPQLAPLLDEHLEDNEGELLPHLVLADVMRWLAARVDAQRETCRNIIGWLEHAYDRGPPDVQGLIAVSGVQMIPDPGRPGSDLRDLLGPALRKIDPWLA